MLLIFPPVAKPCEPPAGVARLAAALSTHQVPCRILDANLEGMMALLREPSNAGDTWSRRASKNLSSNLATLHNLQSYGKFDRYARAVTDINRILLTTSEARSGALASLADYHQAGFSPVRSNDLLRAAEFPEQNPFHHYFSKRLPELIEAPIDPELPGSLTSMVGFSLNYLGQSICAFAMIGFIRKRYPSLKIVLGGGLITSWMRRPDWRNPFSGLVDFLVAGEGEEQLLAMAGVPDPVQRPYEPDYSSLPLGDYLSPGLILPYSGGSGCYWHKCTFCPELAEGTPYRPIPVTTAVSELQHLSSTTHPVLIHLLDNAISPSLMLGLMASPLTVPWYGFARFCAELSDPVFCQDLKRSGCVMLKMGLESGDQEVLDKMHKGIDLGMVSKILQNLQLAGISVYLYLLFGTPAENETAARKTLEFVVRHQQSIGFLNLALFNLPVGSVADNGAERIPFYDGDLSLYTGFRHPEGWDRRKVRQFLDKEFKRHPAVASSLQGDPPLFTSNHAPFRTNRFLTGIQ
jgi:hypothetical protein